MAAYVFTVQDHSGELSSVRFPSEEPAQDGSNYNNVAVVQYEAILAALQALTKGNVLRGMFVAREVTENPNVPGDPYAQREIGARFYYRTIGPLQKRGHFTVPAADLDLLAQTGTDEIDITGGLVDALLSILEIVMEVDGEAPEFIRGRIVGRNN